MAPLALKPRAFTRGYYLAGPLGLYIDGKECRCDLIELTISLTAQVAVVGGSIIEWD